MSRAGGSLSVPAPNPAARKKSKFSNPLPPENVARSTKVAQEAFLGALKSNKKEPLRCRLVKIYCTFGLSGTNLVQFTTNAGLCVKWGRSK